MLRLPFLPAWTTLNTITFHHAFTEAKVTMNSGNGSTAVDISQSTISGVAILLLRLRQRHLSTTTEVQQQ